MHRQNGFTLIELLVTITVLGILLGVGVPALSELVANNRMISATNDLVASLQYARSEAIARNDEVTVCPAISEADGCSGNDWSAGWIVFAQINGNDVALRTSDGSPVIDIVGDATIVYRGDGRAGFAAIRLCDSRGKDHGRAVSLDRTGRPAVGKLTEECP
jgi:type IV fimbrial biogenesis protein FimT